MRVETFSYVDASPLALQAAYLTATEFGAHSIALVDLDKSVANFIDSLGASATDNYALLQAESGLVAAASVIHGLDRGVGNETEVLTIAVRSDLQRQGLGRFLMRHIAREACDHGDTTISLEPIDTQPYLHMGFTGNDMGMRAKVIDLL